MMTTTSDDIPKPETDLASLSRQLQEAIGPKQAEAMEAMRAWGLEEIRKARDRMTEALRAALGKHLTRKKAELEDKTLNVLRQWANEEANPEALVEWLNRGGWKDLDPAKVEARLVAAAKAAAEAQALEGLWGMAMLPPADMELLCYHEPGLVGDANALRENAFAQFKAATGGKRGGPYAFRATILALENMREVVAGREPKRPPLTVRLGFDALKAGLQAYDWPTLSLLAEPATRGTNWLGLLAGAWLEYRLPRAEREADAVAIELRPQAYTEAGDAWTGMPRALDLASVLGGPFAIQVNGDAYVTEPDIAPATAARVLYPRAIDIVPADWLGNPAQLRLALDTDAAEQYLIETATKTAALAALPHLAPKLVGLLFAVAPMSGRPVTGTLLDLARALYPKWADGKKPNVQPWKDRRKNKDDLARIGAAFVAVSNLRWSEEQNGVRRVTDLFAVDYEESAAPDAKIGFALNPLLAERMQGGPGGGYFLLNMSRWLALDTRNPRLFALALRLAAMWHEAREKGVFKPDRLRPIEADRLAVMCNTLPEGAAAYLTGRHKTASTKAKLKEARGNMEADLEDLQKVGLLGDWKPTRRKNHGKGWSLVPVPPEDYAEACERSVAHITKAARKGGRKRGS